MRLSVNACALFALASCFVSAGASTLDGTWRVTGDVQGNPVNPVCVIAEKEGVLSGTCTGTDGKPVAVTGSVKDKDIKWQYNTVYQGGGITLFFTGKIDKEDHITGGVYVEPYAVDGSFAATRDKGAPTSPSAPTVPAAPVAPATPVTPSAPATPPAA